MGKLAEQLDLDALGSTLSRPSPSTYPYSNFQPMFNASFFKISLGSLTSVHQSNYPRATFNSDYQKLQPHTNPLDPHSSLFVPYPHDAPVLQEAVTED